MDFREADRRYTELRQQYDNRSLSAEEFRAQLSELMVEDAEGRVWSKHLETGEWNYYDSATKEWVQATPPGYVEVPDLSGQNVSQASSTLANSDLTLDDAKEETPSEKMPEGQVLRQSPETGTKVEAGSVVTVTVSSGPEVAIVPDVSGRSLEEARRALEDAGFVLASSRQEKKSFSFKKTETVVSTEPSAGSEVALGTSITPIVSSGLAVFPWVLIAALIAALVMIGSAVAITDGGTPTAIIVSDLPLQGSSREQSETMVNAITMALEERRYMVGDGDVQIEYQSQDDATAQAEQGDEEKCEENAQSAAQNQEIVGWIGPRNSGCAEVQIPILNQENLAMVSPSNTTLGLTKPSVVPDEPEKYYPTGERNYTRVIATDDRQARAGAVLMRQNLGVESVYILDDRETYGQGIADLFEQSAEEQGIEVLGHESIDPNAANYRSLMTQIAEEEPGAIYFGGTVGNYAGQLVKDKIGAGMSNNNVIFMGPDGIRNEAFLTRAGDLAEGVYVTFGGPPTSLLPGKGQEFVQQYEERYDSGVESYTVYAYEAANVLLNAIERAYENDGEVTREGVVRELFATQNYDGALGIWSFDEDGDTTLTQLSGQRIEDSSFDFDRDRAVGVPLD